MIDKYACAKEYASVDGFLKASGAVILGMASVWRLNTPPHVKHPVMNMRKSIASLMTARTLLKRIPPIRHKVCKAQVNVNMASAIPRASQPSIGSARPAAWSTLTPNAIEFVAILPRRIKAMP